MHKKLNRFLAAVMLTVTLSSNISVLAEPLSEDIQNKNQYLQNERNKLEEIRREKEELEIKIEKLDASIEKILREKDSNEKESSKLKDDIKTVENEIVNLEKEIEKQEELFKKRIRSLYVNGMGNYLELILASDGIEDLLTRLEFVRSINKFHKEIKSEIEDNKKLVQAHKDKLENQSLKLEELIAQNDEQLLSFNEKRIEQDKLLEKVKNYEGTVISNIQSTEQYVNSFLVKTNSVTNVPIAQKRVSRGKKNVSADEVLAYAARFLGTPYLWGGTRPETGFDCSGFTQYVYAHFGIKVGRTTYDQINDGPRIQKANLKPGDLVFFGTWSNPHHMGIYLGDNKYIHSPRTGDVLKISPMTRRDFVTGVRVI